MIKSAFSGRIYNVLDCLSKFFIRGEIQVEEWQIKKVGSTNYGDADFLVTCKLWSEPQMCDSPTIGARAENLPMHIDYTGKTSIGLKCGEGFNKEPAPDYTGIEVDPKVYFWESNSGDDALVLDTEREILELLDTVLLRQYTSSLKLDCPLS